MGRYVPPEAEGVISGNRLHKKRPPGSTASGQQTIRFEMPFAAWCTSCPRPMLIPQGRRFNATKKRVGNYYTTPIWEFSMRHADCGGQLRIATDPKNTDYRVIEGAKKRDYGDDGDSSARRPGLRGEEGAREEDRQSAFSRLEKTIEDRAALARASERIERLEEDREHGWRDPYTMNQELRRLFRIGRHERERVGRENERLRDRLGGIGEDVEILPETDEDRRRAALVDFGRRDGVGEGRDEIERGMFERVDPKSRVDKHDAAAKTEALPKRAREELAAKVRASVRRTKDPFLVPAGSDRAARHQPALVGLKRKRKEEQEEEEEKEEEGEEENLSGGVARVGKPLVSTLLNEGNEGEEPRRRQSDKVRPTGSDTTIAVQEGPDTPSSTSHQGAPAALVDYDSEESA